LQDKQAVTYLLLFRLQMVYVLESQIYSKTAFDVNIKVITMIVLTPCTKLS